MSAFIAGVIWVQPGAAPKKSSPKCCRCRTESQWVIVRAIAYSGAPNWQAMLTRFADAVAGAPGDDREISRGQAADRLDQFAIDRDPTWYEKVQDTISVDKYLRTPKPDEVKLANTPELLDTLWGYYFATGT